MMKSFTRIRRFAVALTGIAIATGVFRSQVAEALVVRGDDFMYRGNRLSALKHYARAVEIDSDLSVAVDRYVFVSMEQHTAAALRSAISTANAFLSRHPTDATVRADRALCYLTLRQYAAAMQDFEIAAHFSRSSQYSIAARMLRHRREATK
jgi:tetratricopeptide (TPR) repeat protein